jgi:hypothetical protein
MGSTRPLRFFLACLATLASCSSSVTDRLLSVENVLATGDLGGLCGISCTRSGYLIDFATSVGSTACTENLDLGIFNCLGRLSV